MTTYVIGHKKPDVDAVVSAMATAEFRKLRGDKDNPMAVIADPLNPETEFVFKKFGLTPPNLISAADIKPDDKIVLVDHNEEEQRLDGLNPDQIIAIVDHHKANLNLNHPIKIKIEPFGSCTTVVYAKFRQYKINIPNDLAKLMLCAILSDTVGGKSSTTTDKDRYAVMDLAKQSGIDDVDSLTMEIFKAKSNISSLTPEQIVKNDYKVFDFAKKTFIGQLETVEQSELLTNRKDELLKAMESVKSAEGVQLLFLAVSDILAVNTKLLIMGDDEKAVAENAFGGKVIDSVIDIGAKLSRKKDIAPAIEKAIA
jgi:manganese-dependent inorganic pyrophosphatase